MKNLSKKVAIITGAASGTRKSAAKKLAAQGMTVDEK